MTKRVRMGAASMAGSSGAVKAEPHARLTNGSDLSGFTPKELDATVWIDHIATSMQHHQ